MEFAFRITSPCKVIFDIIESSNVNTKRFGIIYAKKKIIVSSNKLGSTVVKTKLDVLSNVANEQAIINLNKIVDEKDQSNLNNDVVECSGD
jgi:hypothetical protein